MKVFQLSRKRSTMNTRISRISQDFGFDAVAVHLPDALFTGPIPFTDRVVTSLNPDSEIRKRRVAITRTSLLNLWIRVRYSPYGALQTRSLRTVARGVCCQHLRWDSQSVRKFRSRLMKDGKPDEYATDEASNFQFADSP
uniref:Uncharacterized protein n=2 Tax=Caenorhabditis japonica TaxID=281687 RepID=A0A8R1IBG0_CAEJA